MSATTQALSTYSNLELALMVLLGYYGNGQERKNRLGNRYADVQAIVEQILRGTVPAGSAGYTKEQISKSLHSVFDQMINDIVKEVDDGIK
jgi:hypothetical protein